MKKPIIALVTDCDDTVAPDTTTKFLKSRGIDTNKFWGEEVKAMLARGWDPSLAYLENILANVGEGKPLGRLTNDDLRQFGATLDSSLYPGVATIREDLQAIASEHCPGAVVEWYVISGGMQVLVEACPILKANCTAIYGCEFEEDPTTGCIARLMRCVTYTEKTRCLFEINKGLTRKQVLANPYAVNKDVPKEKRRIPFSNMIYLGDGLTDIPSFSLVKANGGVPFGIFNPDEERSALRAVTEFMETDRVLGMHAPKYGKGDELGALLRATVRKIATRLKKEQPADEADDTRLTPAD